MNRAIPRNFFTQVNCRSPILLKFCQGICYPKTTRQPNFQLKKHFFFGVSTPVLLFVAIFFEQKIFFNFCYQRLKSIEKKFSKCIIDVRFLKKSIPGVGLATRGFPNLKMLRNRFFFIIGFLISSIFKFFLCIYKPLLLVQKKNKNAFWNF